jgi:DNA-3-methyladenine glycosylase I
MVQRCAWVDSSQIYQDYHDNVWGRPVLDTKELFAKLCLDGQQAGLSWITILKKQQGYEEAFFHFDPHKIVNMTEQDLLAQRENTAIVRNKLKIQSIYNNAKAYLELEAEGQNFSEFIWQFVSHKTIINQWQRIQDVPTSTPESDNMAKALKKRGFSFVGTTICYAFMQAVGMVNDHTTDCAFYTVCADLARR